MKKFCLLLVFVLLVLLGGCTGYQEIDRGYLVTAIGLSEKNGTFSVFLEVVSSSDVLDKPSQRQVLSADGKSFKLAYETLTSQIVKPLYFDQLGTIILNDDLTDENLNLLKPFLKTNYGIYVVKSDDVGALFKCDLPDGFLGYDIIGLIKNHNKTRGKTVANQFFQLTNSSGLLPCVNVNNGHPAIKY